MYRKACGVRFLLAQLVGSEEMVKVCRIVHTVKGVFSSRIETYRENSNNDLIRKSYWDLKDTCDGIEKNLYMD